MKFSFFFIAEYANLMTASALIVSLFFGGWDIPFTTWDEGPPSVLRSLATLAAFSTKTLAFVFLYIWVRWTLPRFRFDQVMELGWKILIPMAIAYVAVIATAVFVIEQAGVPFGIRYGLILTAVNLVAAYGIFWGLDRGRLIKGARAGRRRVAA
jgi:NADH-quinone oxidoreductase subunit H